jgi:phenylpropionate dioxygenase-like ring-hydroxylating dioxygenase large terminal subunit
MEMDNASAFVIKTIAGNSEENFGRMPLGDFFTPEYFALEKERIFKKCWLQIGSEKQIPNVGDYFVKELEVCDTSLIIVRGRDLRIRAFHNVCTHRLNRIAYAPSGNTTGFKCRFHSWSFGLDGRLLAALEENRFSSLVKEENNLTEVACEIWEGFIFVNVSTNPEKSLIEYLGEEFCTGYKGLYRHYEIVGKFTVEMKANWKVCLDAFIEAYHFTTVHAPLAADILASRKNPNGRVDAVRLHPNYRAISVGANLEHKLTFCEDLVRKYGAATLAANTAFSEDNPPEINPLKMEDWLADILVIFPMSFVQQLNGYGTVLDFWPLSHDRTRFEFTLYMRPMENAAHEVMVEYSRSLLRDVVREDLNNLAMIQSNLFSGARKYMNIGDMEVLVGHSYRRVAEYIGHG